LPTSGVLEFDYAGGQRAKVGAEPMSEDAWKTFCKTILTSEGSSADRFSALRALAPSLTVTCTQLRELLGTIFSEELRMDLFCVMFFRISDIYNLKACRARFSAGACDCLKQRLGISFFPFIQPEQYFFQFDFSLHEHKLSTAILVSLQAKEMAYIADPRYVLQDGTVQELDKGVPRSWATQAGVPKSGFFSGTYFSAPEKRSWKTRVEFLQTYARWKIDSKVTAQDVTWWSSLSDTNDDVVLFLEVMRKKYPKGGLDEAFRAIDGGEGGNGEVSLREFETYCGRLKSNWFNGKDNKDRFRSIFRYLDATQEGSISIQEWSQLHSVALELDRQAWELHEFLTFRFGGLEEAFKWFDQDEDGDVTQQEWQEVLHEIGYFGASRELYFILDSTNDGSISIDEFKALSSWLSPPKVERQQMAGSRRRSSLERGL